MSIVDQAASPQPTGTLSLDVHFQEPIDVRHEPGRRWCLSATIYGAMKCRIGRREPATAQRRH
jgi:hypothetical protein